jgi:hypothetical protein
MGAMAALLLPAGPARASEFNRFRVAQVTTGNLPPARADAPFVLGQEVRFRTSVDVKLDRVSVSMGSKAIFDHPFLLWVGTGPCPPLTDAERLNLATFLDLGGFVLVDNAGEGSDHAAFDRFIRTELARAMPSAPLEPVPGTHVLFRSFYRVSNVWGRHARFPNLEGVTHGARLALVYSRNDLSGSWSRDGFGNWEFEAVPGGPAQREQALRLGINIVLYALLLDYKDEQAHVQYLLRRRRLTPGDLEPRPDRPAP